MVIRGEKVGADALRSRAPCSKADEKSVGVLIRSLRMAIPCSERQASEHYVLWKEQNTSDHDS